MKMLLIAPISNNGISAREEIAKIRSHLTEPPIVITDPATTQADIATIASGHKFDVIHFAAHGNADGIHLPNGLMDLEALARLVKNSGAKLVFLNACESVIPMQIIYDAGAKTVIAHASEALDTEALEMATYFYANLKSAAFADVVKAFKVIKPSDGDLIMLPGETCTPDTELSKIKYGQIVIISVAAAQSMFWALFN